MSKVLSILILLFIVSCSSSKSGDEISTTNLDQSAGQGEGKILSEDDAIEFYADEIDEISSDLSDKNDFHADSIMDDDDDIISHNKDLARDIAHVMNEEVKFEDYVVQDDESLMILAFRYYRDIDMWKDIVKWNSGIKEISAGDVIKLKVVDPKTIATWSPSGDPYLIQRNDYLGKIAQRVYEGHGSYWKSIWKNNKVMIKDADLIFPGFTIFYRPIETAKTETKIITRREWLAYKKTQMFRSSIKREISSEIK